MEQLWFQPEGSWFSSTLSGDQKAALIEFFGRTPDEALLHLRMRKIPPRLKRATLQGYLTHGIEPALRTKNDRAKYTLHGRRRAALPNLLVFTTIYRHVARESVTATSTVAGRRHSAPRVGAVERGSVLSRNKAIRRGVFLSVDDLKASIGAFLQAWNQDPKPFVWTAIHSGKAQPLSPNFGADPARLHHPQNQKTQAMNCLVIWETLH